MQLPCAICTPTAWLRRKRPVLMRLGPEWHRVAQCGMVGRTAVWWDIVEHTGVWHNVVQHDMEQHYVVWQSPPRHDRVKCGVVWLSMAWHCVTWGWMGQQQLGRS